RDLSKDVGGIMFKQGMEMLAQDDATDTLLLVSKPPSPEAVSALADAVPGNLRVLAAFVGWDRDGAPFEVHPTLDAGGAAPAPTGPGRPCGGRGRPSGSREGRVG